MKEKITTFIHNLIPYDYMLFGGVFVLFLLFLILAIVMRNKIGFSVFLLLLSFSILFTGPTVVYTKMHEYLYSSNLTIVSQKKLSFTPAIVLKGTLENTSQYNFKECRLRANVLKVSKNALREYFYSFKPLKKMSMLVFDIKKGQTREFKLIIEPFTYKKDYNISLQASCK